MKSKIRNIILWGILTLLTAFICLFLGRWQWHKYTSGFGSFQNLGYAAQWPIFALFLIYAYIKFFLLLKKLPKNKSSPKDDLNIIPREYLPKREFFPNSVSNPELSEYNKYLAKLNKLNQEKRSKHE